MQRARRAATTALALVIAVACRTEPRPVPLGGIARPRRSPGPSSTLVVSEVQTGGASASDEFVEIANQGAGPVDLVGLEVVYATSSGSTVTRKATWAPRRSSAPGQRILLVNGGRLVRRLRRTLVVHGRFRATGGAVALRVVGGAVIDAVGWGDATNAFVEGEPRRPRRPVRASSGGRAARWAMAPTRTTNRLDGSCRAPGPQNLSAPPVPGSGRESPAPTPTQATRRRRSRRRPPPDPDRDHRPTPTPVPTPTDHGTDRDAQPSRPRRNRRRADRPDRDADARTVPDADAGADSDPDPTPRDARHRSSRSRARGRCPTDRAVMVAGVLTTDLGALEAGADGVRPGRYRRDRALPRRGRGSRPSRPGPPSTSAGPSILATPSGPCGPARLRSSSTGCPASRRPSAP